MRNARIGMIVIGAILGIATMALASAESTEATPNPCDEVNPNSAWDEAIQPIYHSFADLIGEVKEVKESRNSLKSVSSVPPLCLPSHTGLSGTAVQYGPEVIQIRQVPLSEYPGPVYGSGYPSRADGATVWTYSIKQGLLKDTGGVGYVLGAVNGRSYLVVFEDCTHPFTADPANGRLALAPWQEYNRGIIAGSNGMYSNMFGGADMSERITEQLLQVPEMVRNRIQMAVSVFYGDSNGKYPASLERIPKDSLDPNFIASARNRYKVSYDSGTGIVSVEAGK